MGYHRWNALLYVNAKDRKEAEKLVVLDRRASWIVVTSFQEAKRMIQKQIPDIQVFLGDMSIDLVQNLKKLNLWHENIMTYAKMPSQQEILPISESGVFRIWTQDSPIRSILNEALCDTEILHSCLQRNDLVSRPKAFDSGSIGLICASTGGPNLVNEIVSQLSLVQSAIVVLQHMPESFVSSFAERLQKNTIYKVETVDDEILVENSKVYLPAGGKHLLFFRKGSQVWLRSVKMSLPDSYTPSMNLGLISAAAHLHDRAHALILSGMGEDSALGSKIMNSRGSQIFCQNPELATVPSMPLASLKQGHGILIKDNEKIAETFMEALKNEQKRRSA